MAANVSVGDRVAGWLHGGYEPGNGSFAEYFKTSTEKVIQIPSNVLGGLAAGIPAAAFTAYTPLLQQKHYGLTPPPSMLRTCPDVHASEKFLIWSGASAMGQFAIQFAHAAGYYVITTVSRITTTLRALVLLRFTTTTTDRRCKSLLTPIQT